MSKEHFLQAIFNKPDSLAILAYADYLEEQGEYTCDLIRDALVDDLRIPVTDGFGDPPFYQNGRGSGWLHGGNENDPGIGFGYGEGEHELTSYGNIDGGGKGNGEANIAGDGRGRGYHNGNGAGELNRNGSGYGRGEGEEYCDSHVFIKSHCIQGLYLLMCAWGWLHVGFCRPNSEDIQQLIVDQCCTVEEWRTERGLSQLAAEGPREGTLLVHEGSGVILRRDWIERAIPCNEAAWANYFSSVQ